MAPNTFGKFNPYPYLYLVKNTFGLDCAKVIINVKLNISTLLLKITKKKNC